MRDVWDVHRASLLLQVWEAINTERELPGVLRALELALVPVVPFDFLGIVKFNFDQSADPHPLYALHIVGVPPVDGESMLELMERHQPNWPKPLPETRPLMPYPPMAPDDLMCRSPYVCDDLLAKDRWFEHDFDLAAGGVRSYVSIPLVARGGVIGLGVFSRVQQRAWATSELSILEDVSRPLAIAVANALANEQIRKLRDQLQAENVDLRAQLGRSPWSDEIVGTSPALRRVLDSLEQVAATDSTVLITGETGTGKELVARAIHRRSPRAHSRLVKVNCAAIPVTLLASELFGHERGAFTGALGRREGRFEQAHGGTLFLDEIGDLPADMQVLLLRVLQEREFERLGGSQTVRVDIRLIAATNRDLEAEVRAGRFRSDLYYRLNVFPVHIPPLRQRPEDIAPLVAHLAEKHAARLGRTISRIDRQALAILQSYAWPGNVRELENVVERAVILARSGVLSVDRDALRPLTAERNVTEDLRLLEREAIEAALAASRGKVAGETGAAARLGLPASTLEFRIRKLGIDKLQFRRECGAGFSLRGASAPQLH